MMSWMTVAFAQPLSSERVSNKTLQLLSKIYQVQAMREGREHTPEQLILLLNGSYHISHGQTHVLPTTFHLLFNVDSQLTATDSEV
jgi:hypothetical protein